MNFGSNSNIRVGDAMFHVQTEDRGPAHPFLDTVVYEAGRVVHKRSTSYEDLVGGPAEDAAVTREIRERLAQQHREVISQLQTGLLSLTKAPVISAPIESPPDDSLAIRLLNPTSWLTVSNVTLDVEVQRPPAARDVAYTDVEVFLECKKNRSTPVGSRADEKGRATLKFLLPSDIPEGTALVIRATDGDLYGELRFRLKPRGGSVLPPAPGS